MTYLGKRFIPKGKTQLGYTIGGKAEQLNNIREKLVPDYVVIPTEVGESELSEVVCEAYISLGFPYVLEAKYAVRSSAVGEDGEGQSYAGIFESKLNVPITGIETAVREVRASAKTTRAKEYLQSMGKVMMRHDEDFLKDVSPDVAVIVMHMVDARYSGVLFSKEPVDGTNRMLVEYEEGVGGVVDGTGNSTMLYLGSKEFSIQREQASMPVSLTEQMIEPLKVIWHEAKRLENNYRKPVDIEWAIDKEGNPWVLQVRPITAMKETA